MSTFGIMGLFFTILKLMAGVGIYLAYERYFRAAIWTSGIALIIGIGVDCFLYNDWRAFLFRLIFIACIVAWMWASLKNASIEIWYILGFYILVHIISLVLPLIALFPYKDYLEVGTSMYSWRKNLIIKAYVMAVPVIITVLTQRTRPWSLRLSFVHSCDK